jgi:deoxyribodipyrimidine photo-lyase
MESDDGDTGDRSTASGAGDSGPVVPVPADIPTPAAVSGEGATGYVVWHRKHLRTEDHLALSRAVAGGDVVCPLFVFDPQFYETDGLACDARVRFLHEAVTSLDRLYAAAPGQTSKRRATRSIDSVETETPLAPGESEATTRTGRGTALCPPETPGLTVGYGDPVALLSAFVDRGWSVLTMATPTSRYGQRRDERVGQACDGAVEFVSGDGLVRDREWSRTNWQTHVQEWLAETQHTPEWDAHDTTRFALDTGVTPALVDDGHDVTPEKELVPTGTHRLATTRLREFVDRIRSYPGNISAPQDAREGTSGLSPYINFGLLSVRQVHQYVADNAPACRGRSMFNSRLVWNMHYNQKLADWPGWTDRAVNPVLEGRNEDSHDPTLVEAWKQGETGFPMVDASMRCLRETGWLNFRMRAMCASFFTHILQQPWWVGADWYHHHLIDSDVGINYTQWQSQAGLVGKPSQRVYNPRKQVRDHDPEGEWITEWVPELEALPSHALDRPEQTPLAVQAECGVVIGEDYPRPVVDFETRREAFWSHHERHRAEAARELARPAVAKRASFSGGYAAARAIAEKHGHDAGEADHSTQASLTEVGPGSTVTGAGEQSTDGETRPDPTPATGQTDEQTTVPTGTGRSAGDPSPDDRAATPDRGGGDSSAHDSGEETSGTEAGPEQTTMGRFE